MDEIMHFQKQKLRILLFDKSDYLKVLNKNTNDDNNDEIDHNQSQDMYVD